MSRFGLPVANLLAPALAHPTSALASWVSHKLLASLLRVNRSGWLLMAMPRSATNNIGRDGHGAEETRIFGADVLAVIALVDC